MAHTEQNKKIHRILVWSSIAGLLLMLGLLLRKSPPPKAAYDPAAAARVEKKIAAANEAKAQGKPVQVQMDSAELSSYIAHNLQIAQSDHSASPNTTIGSQALDEPAGDLGDASSAFGSDRQSNGTSSIATSPTGSTATNGAASKDAEPTLEQVQSSVKDVKVDMDGDLVKAYVIYDFHGQDMSLELDGHLSAENGYIKFDPVGGKLGSLPLPQSTLETAVQKLMESPENREKLKLPDDISNIQIVDGKAVLSYK